VTLLVRERYQHSGELSAEFMNERQRLCRFGSLFYGCGGAALHPGRRPGAAGEVVLPSSERSDRPKSGSATRSKG
jgi:hypothetical protein